ncbi:hypothetical protein [Adhaeribacter pallidiroseus]|uniref:Uncharacterized protein n=1 Tax=Adhaeribacter pallidiroseus TaxID=2072847 RepID=A0A369QMY2_9BACT|nr:hypothetical protein [Adhaeribacter pallidiroseus]RDC64219.1 hypothetical protein AHMF7616_02831 [Adhaeribacter pallidiroseus]
MRPELEDIKQLEDLVNGSLPEEQAQDLEIRLLWDQSWQLALRQQQVAYQAIRAAGRQQLRAELKSIHARLFS